MLKKILIVDANEEFCLALTAQLGADLDVRCCGNGRQALETLRRETPDLLVLDLMLPEIDGVTLLQQIRSEGISVPALVTSVRFSSYVTNALMQLGVQYAMLKPCSLSAITARIDDLLHANALMFFSPSSISELLIALGVPTHRKGFHYCQEALKLLLDNPFQQVTKTVYPEVGKRFGVKKESVEKDIREVVQQAWSQGERRIWLQYFPAAPNGQIPKPTNTVFLTRLREAISASCAIAR